ncbi:MAG TPA: amino acid adenylation domain-containing protein, partial [Ktedonobacteraceae bacterium]|nr:amino acid adenylation domain-containing protein [Ktedonobacteraceae bacterium]
QSLFAAPTIAQLASSIEQGSDAEPVSSAITIPRAARDGHLPLSFSQERVWFIQQLDPGSLAYNTQTLHRLSGMLDVAALERSLNEIVRRHEIFRTTFPEVDGRPVQIIHPALTVKLPLIDLQRLDKEEREAVAQQLIHEELRRPFALTQLPLLRWTLLRLAAHEHVLILVEHHLVHDGWSANVLLSETLTLYEAFAAGKPSPLPELPIQFADFAVWQRQWMEGDVAKTQMAYWKQKLSDSPPSIDLPTDRPRSPQQSFLGATLHAALPPHIGAGLRALSKHEGVTLFMTMFSAFLILLYRYSGQEDLPVGTAIANRRWRETEGLLGMIINNVVLRTQMIGNPPFRELLRRVHTVTTEAYANQDLPFDQVVTAVQPGRDATRNPLFQIMFNFHDPPMPDLKRPHLMVSLDESISNGSAKFDMNVLVVPRAEQYLGKHPQSGTEEFLLVWEYNTDLFDESTIARMLEQYQILLANIVAHPEQRISDLRILPDAEKQQLLIEWNTPQTHYPHTRCIHELVEEQVALSSDAIALVYEEQHLTYAELNARANQVAHRLRQLGVGPETLVGLYLQRSLEMIVGLLGILKAGGAYVPLDPDYPIERIEYMLQDAQIPVLLTTSALSQKIAQQNLQPVYTICLESADEQKQLFRQPVNNIAVGSQPEDLAYVIYTSGSTGRPKGVQITHANVVRLFAATNPDFHFDRRDVWTMFHSYAFDFSVWEIWGALLYGGRLVLVPYLVSRSPEEFYRLLCREGITVLNQTPSAFSQLIWAEENSGTALELALRLIIFGGEALDFQKLQPWFERHGDQLPALVNMYGITETTVHVTRYRLSMADLERPAKSVIGRPIADLRIYVLDQQQRPAPIGVTGELFIGGAGLALGYLRRPELTAERFLPDPFGNQPGARLYKTGDLARYRCDGS